MFRSLLSIATPSLACVVVVLGCHPHLSWHSVMETPVDADPQTRWAQIDRGVAHACGVTHDARGLCWGDNTLGQVGGRSRATVASPFDVGLSQVEQIATGAFHTCALHAGQVSCWGHNDHHQLGNAVVNTSRQPLPVHGLPEPAVDVACGFAHSCALLESGAVMCWGLGASGQLGAPDVMGGSAAPLRVGGLEEADLLALGGHHSCARQRSGGVFCWGANWGGQLGGGTLEPSALPVAVQGTDDVVELALGDAHSCARTSSGALACWGSNSAGQLGDGTREDALRPWRVVEVEKAISLSAGALETCAIERSGKAVCWGQRLATPHYFEDERREVAVQARQVATSASGSCVVTEDEEVRCWGLKTPQTFSDEPALLDVDTGYLHSCALGGSGQVYCWGDNSSGQLGHGGDEALWTRPTLVEGLAGAVQISTGGGHTCARRSSGEVMCWGYGGDGQLGDGRRSARSSVTPVSGLTDTVDLSAGDAHTCAVDGAGQIWCWGWNRSGQLGDGTTEDRLEPVAVEGLEAPAVWVSAGYEHTCAVLETGQIACWGYNVAGELGDGSTHSSARPVVVDLPEVAVAVSAGDSHTCALDRQGRAWCWGKDSLGQLGNGEAQSQTRPMLVEGIFGASHISAGSGHSCASLREGEVWCWGLGDQGQTGDASLHPDFLRVRPVTLEADGSALDVIAESPVKLPGLRGVRQVEAGYKRTCVLVGRHEVLCSGNED